MLRHTKCLTKVMNFVRRKCSGITEVDEEVTLDGDVIYRIRSGCKKFKDIASVLCKSCVTAELGLEKNKIVVVNYRNENTTYDLWCKT